MKKEFFLVATLIFSLNVFSGKKTVSVTTDVWCPYVCGNTSKESGYMMDVLNKLLPEQGYHVELKIMNWNDSVSGVRSGKITGLLGTNEEDVPDFVFPKEPLGIATFHIFVNKKSVWKYQGLESLKGKKIGVIEGNIYDKMIMGYMKEKNPSLVVVNGKDPLLELVKKLEEGTIDGIYEDPNVLAYTFKKIRKDNRFADIGPIENFQTPVYLALSPKFPDAAKLNVELDKGIQRLRSSGELKKILKKYQVTDWIKK